jgi:hypothetical protein
MGHDWNSIFSSSYETIRNHLDTMILRGGYGSEGIPNIGEKNLPLAVCALLVAYKGAKIQRKKPSVPQPNDTRPYPGGHGCSSK